LHLFLSRIVPDSGQERFRRRSLGTSAATIGMLDTFKRICKTPPYAAAGESITTVWVDSLMDLPL
jgi:hypothetical protein